MNDIENYNLDETEIKNPYSKNPFWHQKDKVDSLDIDEFEFKKYQQDRKLFWDMVQVNNFSLIKFSYIMLAIIFIIGILGSLGILIWKTITNGLDQDLSMILTISCSFCACTMSFLIDSLLMLQKQYPFHNLQFFKKYQKAIKDNYEVLRQWGNKLAEFEKNDEYVF